MYDLITTVLYYFVPILNSIVLTTEEKNKCQNIVQCLAVVAKIEDQK